jgi:hypothetical protein
MSRKKPVLALIILAMTSVTLMGAQGGCVPGAGAFKKDAGAADPVVDINSFATISQCPGFQSFAATTHLSLQQQCASCHTSAGVGGSKFTMYSGSVDDTALQSKNYTALKAKLTLIDGADATNIDTSRFILAKLNGTLSHSLNLGVTTSSYAAFRDWVGAEIDTPCVIDPVTGIVTVISTTPGN